MYESHFGMAALPFRLSPDPGFYYDSLGHHHALVELRQALKLGNGGIVVSGDVGAGKSTLVRTMLAELDTNRIAVAHIVSSQLDANDLLIATLRALGLSRTGASLANNRSRLARHVLKLAKAGRRCLVVIDEAHNLTAAALRPVVELITRTRQTKLSLQLCLVGQPELLDLLLDPELQALRRVIRVFSRLGPLESAETGLYVQHRLEKAGWTGVPKFAPTSFDEIYRWTGGVPRRINLLCNRLLLACCLSSITTIDEDLVAQIARERDDEWGIEDAQPRAALSGGRCSPPRIDAADLAAEQVSQHLGSAPVVASQPALQATHIEAAATAAPTAAGMLWCVADGHSDHIKAAALMRAVAATQRLPPARLVRIHRSDSLELTRILFDAHTAESVIDLDMHGDCVSMADDRVSAKFQALIATARPVAVIVFDGSAVALACATVAHGEHVPVVHVGAGARIGDGSCVHDAIARATDAAADLLYTTDAVGSEALKLEAAPAERSHCAGSLLADALMLATNVRLQMPDDRVETGLAEQLLETHGGYALVMLDHPANLANKQTLSRLVEIVRQVGRDIPAVWPCSVALCTKLHLFQLDNISDADRIVCVPTQPHSEHLSLLRRATCVFTDLWQVQEESTALGVPCFTVGLHPGHPVTSSVGSNTPVGMDASALPRLIWDCKFNGGKRGAVPMLWDGKASARIAGFLAAWLAPEPGAPHRMSVNDTTTHWMA